MQRPWMIPFPLVHVSPCPGFFSRLAAESEDGIDQVDREGAALTTNIRTEDE